MINDGQVYLAGYVASPPSFKFVGGKPTATVRVAFTPRWISRETGEWADGPTSFVNVLCWRALAGNVAVSLRKGEPVLVMGRLRVRRYPDKEGAMKLAVEVEAQSIGHDLTRGVAAFSRARRVAGETALEAAEALMNGGVGPAQAGARPAGRRSAGVPGDGADSDDGAPDDGAPGGEVPGGEADSDAGITDAGVTDAGVSGGGLWAGGVPDGGEEGLDGELDEGVVARLAREADEPLRAVGAI